MISRRMKQAANRDGVCGGNFGRCPRRLGAARWTPAIEDDYRAWLKQNEDHLSVSKDRVEEILKDHE